MCWLLRQLLHALKPVNHAKHTIRLAMIFSSITECKQKANKLSFHLWCAVIYFPIFLFLSKILFNMKMIAHQKKKGARWRSNQTLVQFSCSSKNKNRKTFVCFLDVKCLNDGQNWEKGFIHGLQHSQVIVPLVSHSVCIFVLCGHHNSNWWLCRHWMELL
jgi:hypothetical protein